MPTSSDLMAFGVTGDLANDLGNDRQSVTAAGTTQATATAAGVQGELLLVTAAASQTGVTLPVNGKIGTMYYVFSIGSAAPKIYAPGTNTLNGVVATTGVTLSGVTANGMFMRTGTTTWVSFPLAP